MTPEQLKASILQMAMQGKLVEQRPNEGTGTDLYNKIVDEKEKLIKTKAIKKVKIDEEVSPEAIPFDIPESWKWVKIGMLEEINLGFTYRPEYTEEGVYFLSVKDISGGTIDFTKAKKVSQETYDNAAYGSKPRKGDILFGRVGTIGKPQIIETDETFCIFVSLGFFRDHTNNMDKKYVSYWMDTKLFDAQVNKNVKGAAQKNLNTNWLKDFLIPLPPLEEQHRIVSKIEEILPYIDRYAEACEKLEQFNAKFPDDMKKSILQYAIQGKLVEQRPEEGTGTDLYNKIVAEKEKLIKTKAIKKVKIDEEVSPEAIPFDIPESWKWVKIGMLEEINLGFTYRPEYTEEGVYFLSVKDISGGTIDFTKAKKVSQETYDNAAYGSKPRKGDILFGRVGTIGKPQIIETDETFCIFVSLGFFRDHTNNMDKKYVSYWMDTKLFDAQVNKNVKGAAQKNLNTNWLKDFLIPLPPLEEQHRIVAKIEELLPYCDRLVK